MNAVDQIPTPESREELLRELRNFIPLATSINAEEINKINDIFIEVLSYFPEEARKFIYENMSGQQAKLLNLIGAILGVRSGTFQKNSGYYYYFNLIIDVMKEGESFHQNTMLLRKACEVLGVNNDDLKIMEEQLKDQI